MTTKSYWQQFERQRISRRRLLAVSGAGAAGLAVAAACGGKKKTTTGRTTPSAAGTPKRGGIYKDIIQGDWGGIDPVTTVSFGPAMVARLYNCLLDRSRTQTDYFYYDLAETYEHTENEEYIFTIRKGVKIAPNSLGIEERDMDAQDLKAWLDRVKADEKAVIRAFTNQWLDTYSDNEDGTFTIKTKGPYAYFLFRIGAPLGGTIPPREFADQKVSLEDKGVGGGPFVLDQSTFSNTGGASIKRNPNYYLKDADNNNAQLPYIDGIDFARISDRQARRTAFLSNQTHTYDPETIDEVNDLKNQLSGMVVNEAPANTFIAFTMNPEKDPWKDEKIRKAALNALNRQEFVDIIVKGAGKPNGLVHWPLGDYALPQDELAKLQPYKPAESKRLIKEATGKDTISIDVIYPGGSDIEFHKDHLPIFLKQMKDAGFDIHEVPQDFTTWLINYLNLDYDASLSLNQIYETPEIPIDFHAAKGPQGDRNYAIGIGGLYPEIEQAISESKSITDPRQQIAKVQEVQRLLYAKGPAFLPIMSWQDFTVYQPFVKNLTFGLGGTGLYLNNWWLDL